MTQARPVLLLDFDYTLAFSAAVYLETAWNVLGRLIREQLHTGDAHVHAVLAAAYNATSAGGFTTAALVERVLIRCGTPEHLMQDEMCSLTQEIDEKFWAVLATEDCLFPDVRPALSALHALDIELLLVTAGDKAFQTRKLHSMRFERLIPETRWILTDV